MHVQSSGHALSRRADAPCDDAWIVRERAGAFVAALADGISSAREGGAAARRAVEMLADYCLARPRTWSPRRALAEFTTQINRQLHGESLAQHDQPELACTLSAVLIEDGRLYGCNVGDSPIFHWQRGRLTRLSETHTFADPALAHVLTRAIGLAPDVEPYFFEVPLSPGDLVLLCSDGVTTALSETQLAELLSRQATARSIVRAAHDATKEVPALRDDTCAIVLDLLASDRESDATLRPLEVPATLHARDEIDGHRLVRPLAGHERVWLADDPQGTRVVLKFPPADAADLEVLRDAFRREVRTAMRLASPDLVRAWVPAGPALRCYAMEFVNAPTLRSVLLQGRLTVEDARELARFLLRVGQFLLRHDLVHGDIKPDNILVVREPAGISFRLLDLGSAAELFSVTSRAGTASYLAPERFQGGALSERTEIFALGVTLYEALTGTYPYGEIERFQTPRFTLPPRRLTKLNAVVPPWLDSVILRSLDPDPERRYQLFSEMAYEVANPERVTFLHRKDAPLLERNPLLFYKSLCLALGLAVAVLALLLARR